MMDGGVETSPRLWARLAGAFYLITIIMGVFAEVFVRGTLVVRDDAAATATNILAHEPLYRLGLAADLIMLASYIAVTLLFYSLFKSAGRSLSLLAAFSSLVGIAVLAVNSLNHLAPLVLLGNAHYLSAFEPTQLQALALIALKMHARGYNIAGVFFGVYCLMIGYLVFRSGFLPRILGALMAIGGIGYVIDSFAIFLSPSFAAHLPDLSMLGGIAELALCLWLLVMGVDAGKANARRISGA
ncbi:DUF4386 domain-containing protein [Dokdonella soli]|uniref:DUF4386 domain-containing protein n=2 Tax=Dokdonella soli TaxID=529810 RepID=A0ABN1IKX9_9GAMM